jgi:hypothetical protein
MPSGSGIYAQQIGTQQETTYNVNGTVSIGGLQPVVIDTGNWTRTSIGTPGFKRAFNSGKSLDLPMNGFHFSNDRSVAPYGSSEYTDVNLNNGQVFRKIKVGLFAIGVIVPSRSELDSASLDFKASTKLSSQFKNQDVNVGVAMAESRQVVKMVVDSATKLARAAHEVKKGNIGAAAIALGVKSRKGHQKRGATNSVASNWLELQYGWKPLLSDVYGAAQFLAKQNYYVPRTRCTSSSTKTKNSSARTIETLGEIIDVTSSTHTVKYVVYFSEPSGGNIPVALGLTNPLAIAWELVPFSFVVDWFLPIGTYLNNLDSTQGLTFVKGCKTEFWRGTSSRTEFGTSETVGGHRYSVRKNLRRTYASVWVTRTKLNGFPSSPVPQLKSPFSDLHAANALALLAQAFR